MLCWTSQIQLLIVEQYRILAVLDPTNCAADIQEDIPFEKLGLSISQSVRGMGSLSRYQSSKNEIGRSSRVLQSRKSSIDPEAVDSIRGDQDRPYLSRRARSLEMMDRGMSTFSDRNSPEDGARKCSLRDVFYNSWLFFITTRQTIDGIAAVRE